MYELAIDTNSDRRIHPIDVTRFDLHQTTVIEWVNQAMISLAIRCHDVREITRELQITSTQATVDRLQADTNIDLIGNARVSEASNVSPESHSFPCHESRSIT